MYRVLNHANRFPRLNLAASGTSSLVAHCILHLRNGNMLGCRATAVRLAVQKVNKEVSKYMRQSDRHM